MHKIGVLSGSFTETDALQAWLLVVAALRALSVGLGYFAPGTLLSKVFTPVWSGKEKEDDAPDARSSGVAARTFAVWTAVTCVVTATCAFHLDQPVVVGLTAASFAAALLFFGAELTVFGTMTPANIAGPTVVASVSVVWLLRHMGGLE